MLHYHSVLNLWPNLRKCHTRQLVSGVPIIPSDIFKHKQKTKRQMIKSTVSYTGISSAMHTCMQHQIRQCGALRTYPWQCRALTQTCIVGPYDLRTGGQPHRPMQGLVNAEPHRTVTHHSWWPLRPQKVNFLFLIHHPHAFLAMELSKHNVLI